MVFQSNTLRAKEIRQEANYAGVRITLLATLDGARCQIQIDIGFGDAVTPAPLEVEYPTLLQDFEAPKLRAYPRYTVVAEKFEALSTLGMANSRMKDYFDLWILARHADFDGDTLSKAIRATFSCRNSNLSATPPMGLTLEFAQDAQKQTQWKAFLRKNALDALSLGDVVNFLADFLMSAAEAASSEKSFPFQWVAGGPWTARPFV